LASHTAENPNRRDFIVIAAQAFAGVGAALALWPFISQMNPDASTQAAASMEVDLSPVKEGQAITVQTPKGAETVMLTSTSRIHRGAQTIQAASLTSYAGQRWAISGSTSQPADWSTSLAKWDQM